MSRTRCRKLSIQNFKGGVGKTSIVRNVGAGLVERGFRVLLIDCDTQGDLTEVCGVRLEKKQPTLYHVLIDDLNIKDVILPLSEDLHLLPSDKKLAAAEALMVSFNAREHTLTRRLEHLSDYDFVLLDCAPAMNLMHQNALLFAEELVIPVDMDKLALSGCRAILESVKTLGDYNFRQPELTGVIPTFVDQRTNITTQVMAALGNYYAGHVLPGIRLDTKLKQAAAQSMSIFEFDPKCKAAQDYRALVDALLGTKAGPGHERVVETPAG